MRESPSESGKSGFQTDSLTHGPAIAALVMPRIGQVRQEKLGMEQGDDDASAHLQELVERNCRCRNGLMSSSRMSETTGSQSLCASGATCPAIEARKARRAPTSAAVVAAVHTLLPLTECTVTCLRGREMRTEGRLRQSKTIAHLHVGTPGQSLMRMEGPPNDQVSELEHRQAR